MTIENKNNLAEATNEIAASIKSKEGISKENTVSLADDLKNIDDNVANKEAIKYIQQKLNFRDVTKAGPTDVLKWTAFEHNLESISKDQAINLILSLWLITADDLKNLSSDALTKKIQTWMFDRIKADPLANAKMQEFLAVKWLPFDWLIDGKFGARSLFGLNLLVNPPKAPEKVAEIAPQELVFKPAPSWYSLNIRWDMDWWWYYFAKNKEEFLKITQMLWITGNITLQDNDTWQATYNMSNQTLKDYLDSNSLWGDFAYRNKIKDLATLDIARQQMKDLLWPMFKRDTKNNTQMFAQVDNVNKKVQVRTGEAFVKR
jgi:hypothetical protein